MKTTIGLISGIVIAAAALFSGVDLGAQETKMEKPVVAPSQILIVYYSWSGNTRTAAEEIQKATGGEIFELVPAVPYPDGLGAFSKQVRAELKSGAKPELKSMPDVERYKVIFVGSPNWGGTMAPPVRTFLSSEKLNGKIIVPFFTHGGGGMQKCERDVQELCAESTVLPAETFIGGTVKLFTGKFKTFVDDRIEIKK